MEENFPIHSTTQKGKNFTGENLPTMQYTIIWLYFALKIFRMLLFRTVIILYAPHIVYETPVKVSLLKNIRTFHFRTDGSVRN